MTDCPCGSDASYENCCGPIISGALAAPTAEALMRSRFTAFARGNLDHIHNTHAREERDTAERSAVRNTFSTVEWIKLEILDTVAGGVDDDTGIVEFAAHYRQDGQNGIHGERSKFRRDDGRWIYVDGAVDDVAVKQESGKVGRNQPCPCGSGKKYKKCCGA